MATPDLSSKLAEFTVGFQLDAVPTKALENAKIAILDCLGVAVLATRQEIGIILLNFARNSVGTGPCTIWGTALKTTPRDAALINGTLAHAERVWSDLIELPCGPEVSFTHIERIASVVKQALRSAVLSPSFPCISHRASDGSPSP